MFFLDSVDASLLVAAGASFVAGVFGFIIARYWVKPLVRYNVVKRRLERCLDDYLKWIGTSEAAATRSRTAAGILREARRHGMTLVACYTRDLPYWYRLLLESRQESPMAASGLLTNLSKIGDRRQVEKRIAEARRNLNLKTSHGT